METTNNSRVSRPRDVYRSFYTSDQGLVSYMVKLLSPEPGHSCLEPCAGAGAFVDSLLAASADMQITACELSSAAVEQLHAKYAGAQNVRVKKCDFLMDPPDLFDTIGVFDRIIGNPPYGGWQDYEKRAALKARFPGLYVRETYGLFLAQALRRLRLGGRLVFILPETFLYLHLQRGLRRLLLDNVAILSLDIFPSSLFPRVNFGYAKLCIVCLDYRKPEANHHISIRHSACLDELVLGTTDAFRVPQATVMARQDFTFPLRGDSPEARLIDHAALRLGDVADCVTGIYTGDDRRFLRRAPANPRGNGRYREVNTSEVVSLCPGERPLQGVEEPRTFIPILKGGGVAYFKQELWFIDWSILAVAHYRRDEKARFQNRGFYFRRGIGFPMVTSGRATASVIQEHWLFDQSIVGVFPRDPGLLGFLLALLNSTTCWQLLREINPSANNSAKYVRKLPIVLPCFERMSWFAANVESYISRLAEGGPHESDVERELDAEVADLYRSLVGYGAAAQHLAADAPLKAGVETVETPL
jgi:adenine-specific DNA-methyltransferase